MLNNNYSPFENIEIIDSSLVIHVLIMWKSQNKEINAEEFMYYISILFYGLKGNKYAIYGCMFSKQKKVIRKIIPFLRWDR